MVGRPRDEQDRNNTAWVRVGVVAGVVGAAAAVIALIAGNSSSSSKTSSTSASAPSIAQKPASTPTPVTTPPRSLIDLRPTGDTSGGTPDKGAANVGGQTVADAFLFLPEGSTKELDLALGGKYKSLQATL